MAIEEDMIDNIKSRKTALEDQLYNKVQELKKICLQEAVSAVLFITFLLMFFMENGTVKPIIYNGYSIFWK